MMIQKDITIRHLQASDLADVHEIFKGQSIIDGTMRLPYQPLEYTQKRMAQSDEVIKLVAVAEDDQNGETVVGYTEMVTYPNTPRHRHVGEIDMILVREGWQGNGIGRRLTTALIDLAEQWLQISRLCLIVWTDNDALHLYRKLGFEIEGTMPEYAFRNGRYVDAHIMGRLVSKRTQNQITSAQYERTLNNCVLTAHLVG